MAGSDGDRSAPTAATPLPITAPEAPPEFAAAAAALRSVTARPEVRLAEAPAPGRLAPYGVALTATVSDGDGEDELAHGRLILLYDPAGHEAWDGCARLVTYIRTELEAELVSDPLLHDVAWHWLEEALLAQGVTMAAASGTVTRVQSHSYGELATDSEDEPAGELEIRASWSPGEDVRAHVEAWVDVLCIAAGLPPVLPGVLSLPGRRSR
jgi:hypothetical protein